MAGPCHQVVQEEDRPHAEVYRRSEHPWFRTFFSGRKEARPESMVVGQAAGDERGQRGDGPPHEQLVGLLGHSGEEAE